MVDLIWVGLDVGDYQTHICIIDNDGRPISETNVETAPHVISDILAQHPIDRFGRIVMEAGLPCTGICRHLRALGYPAAIYDARRIHRFLSMAANKTDVNDARGIAQVARIGSNALREVHIKSAEIERLRGEIVLRDSLVRQRVAAETSMKSMLRACGIRIKPTSSARVFRERVEEGLTSLGTEGAALLTRIRPLLELSESLRSYVAHQDDNLRKEAERIDATRRFLEIPSIGPICALSFYTAIEDPFRFKRASNVGAYLGLSPRLMQSGKVRRMGRITRFGSTMTRSHLFLAARTLNRKTTTAVCDVRTWGETVAERAGKAKARVAIARKLAMIMLAMWRDGTSFVAVRERT